MTAASDPANRQEPAPPSQPVPVRGERALTPEEWEAQKPPSLDAQDVAPSAWEGPGRYRANRDTFLRYCPIGQAFGMMRTNDTIDASQFSSGYVEGYVYGCMNARGWVQSDAITHV